VTRSFLLILLLPTFALADTAVLEINYLPLSEAENIVKSQLSPSGSTASMPSRRIIVITDRAANIEQAKALLKRLDVQAEQYRATLELITLDDERSRSLRTTAQLPGGWIRVSIKDSQTHLSNRKQYSLHLTAGGEGSIESGTIRPYRQSTKQWLAGYGVIHSHSVELVPITSGFHATVRPAGNGMVNVRIVPWMRSQRANPSLRGETEVLIDLGATNAPRQAPNGAAPVRLNAHPSARQGEVIEIAGAATEVTIPVGETITIAANREEAEQLGDAMLSTDSTTGKTSFAIRLTVNQR
jgi:hypothetical protein